MNRFHSQPIVPVQISFPLPPLTLIRAISSKERKLLAELNAAKASENAEGDRTAEIQELQQQRDTALDNLHAARQNIANLETQLQQQRVSTEVARKEAAQLGESLTAIKTVSGF